MGRTTGGRAAIVLALGVLSLLLIGARRVPDGCGGGGRLLRVTQSGAEAPLPHPARTLTFSEADLGSFVPFDTVQWRGDANAYIDVFDVDVPLTSDRGTGGARFAQVIRMRYPTSLGSSLVFEVSPLAVASRSDAFPLEYLGARSLRAYDRGECSSAIPWREIGDAFAAGLDEGIEANAERIFPFGVDEACMNDPNCVTGGTALELCPIPSRGYQITPILRDEFAGPRDAFIFTRSYALRLCAGIGQTRVRVQFSGRFQADTENRLGFRLLWVTAQDPGGATKDVVEEPLQRSLEGTVNEQIASVIRQPVVDPVLLPRGISCNLNDDDADASCLAPVRGALGVAFGIEEDGIVDANVSCEEFEASQTGAACHLTPNVYRVNHRPDGVEVVLSEVEPFNLERREADPLFPLLMNEGFCDRFPAETRIDTCYMDTVFEIPPSSFPEVCGDALME